MSSSVFKFPDELVNRDLTIDVLACLLNALDEHVSDEALEPSPFVAMYPPSISASAYFRRLCKYTPQVSPQALLCGFVYLNLLLNMEKIQINRLNAHRLVLVSNLLAHKFMDDKHYDNKWYAKTGGVEKAELLELELALLKMMDYDLWISPETYKAYCEKLFCVEMHQHCTCLAPKPAPSPSSAQPEGKQQAPAQQAAGGQAAANVNVSQASASSNSSAAAVSGGNNSVHHEGGSGSNPGSASRPMPPERSRSFRDGRPPTADSSNGGGYAGHPPHKTLHSYSSQPAPSSNQPAPHHQHRLQQRKSAASSVKLPAINQKQP